MIRTIFNNRNIKSIANVFAIAMISLFASCNKDFQNKLDFDGDVSNQDIKGTEYKIAYLVIEGGVGAIVGQQATDYGKMPNLAAVSLNSVFSWNSISNENKNISTSFADLLTGVEVAKHQVKDGTSSNNIQNYPTLFKRVKQYTASKTALFTTNSIYKSFVEDNVLDSYTLSTNDEEVKNNAVEEIKKDNAGVVLASFGDAYKVGEAQGYNSEAYLNALNSIDTKIEKQKKSISKLEQNLDKRITKGKISDIDIEKSKIKISQEEIKLKELKNSYDKAQNQVEKLKRAL